jgi:hypothetical protein
MGAPVRDSTIPVGLTDPTATTLFHRPPLGLLALLTFLGLPTINPHLSISTIDSLWFFDGS